MKKGGNKGITIVVLCFFALLAFLAGFSALYNKTVFIVSICTAAGLFAIYIIIRKNLNRSFLNGIAASAYKMSGNDGEILDEIASPVLVLSPANIIVWCNKSFSNTVCSRKKVIGQSAENLMGETAFDKLIHFKSAEFAVNDKIFKAFIVGETDKTVYLVDQTVLKKTAAEYRFSRPVAAVLEIDSLDETLKGERNSKKIQIVSRIQEIIERWFSGTNGIISTLSESSFLLIFEQRYLKGFEDEKFRIVEQIRELEIDGNKRLTLSVGVGYGCKTLHDCEALAHQALDMALSRGGDQAAVKAPDEDYRFYGGVKAVAEKGSRVRTRITAQALSEALMSADRAVIMGHRFSDFDSFGAAVGVAAIAKYLGVQTNIVINKETSMAKPLISVIEKNGMNELLVSPEQALDFMDSQTLLIVVDTHRPLFTESPEVYEKASKVIVIDHHRKSTDYISNAIVFYNETVSSSTCEIITELWQYIGNERLSRVCASALLSGIMLDTKNFVLNTGVRTYEAAAYLRRCMAEPVEVRKMFADSMVTEKGKYEVISTAESFMECAVAVNYNENENSRLIAAQAADELLDVEGVKASFVLFKAGSVVNISARSYGEINVQIIMEKLGGGGHRTMSGCTLNNHDFDSALRLLEEKIKEYFDER